MKTEKLVKITIGIDDLKKQVGEDVNRVFVEYTVQFMRKTEGLKQPIDIENWEPLFSDRFFGKWTGNFRKSFIHRVPDENVIGYRVIVDKSDTDARPYVMMIQKAEVTWR